ncbi:hypothetical protein JT359_08500 [Candidatus Poribacteria bacterium]|nr:hypothetical protein [Candidatus Poribacteria bacterium]
MSKHPQLIILITLIIGVVIGAGGVLLLQHTDTEPATLKTPPPGETDGTGYWRGDKWHRTVPHRPESVSVNGEVLTYEELEKKTRQSARRANPYALRVLEEYPYSEAALHARYILAKYDENLEMIYDKPTLIHSYREMLKYHPDSPRPLHDLALATRRNFLVNPFFMVKQNSNTTVYIQRTRYMVYGQPLKIFILL